MSFGKTIDIYSEILGRGFDAMRKHKGLWIFGAFAAMIHSGAVIHSVFYLNSYLQPASEVTTQSLLGAFPPLRYAVAYITDNALLGSASLITAVIISFIALALLLAAGIAGQHILMHGLHTHVKTQKKLSFATLIQELKTIHYGRIFVIDLVLLIIVTLLVTIASLILSQFLAESLVSDTFIYTAVYLIALPLAFAANAISMFMLVHVIEKDRSLDQALHRSMATFKQHWLTILEVSVLIFVVNLAAYIAFVYLLAALAIPLAVIAIGSILTGSYILFGVGMLFIAFAFIAAIILFVGAVTSWNYATWLTLNDALRAGKLGGLLEKLSQSVKRQS